MQYMHAFIFKILYTTCNLLHFLKLFTKFTLILQDYIYIIIISTLYKTTQIQYLQDMKTSMQH